VDGSLKEFDVEGDGERDLKEFSLGRVGWVLLLLLVVVVSLGRVVVSVFEVFSFVVCELLLLLLSFVV
jgi:hypothetical protein